MKVLIIGLGSIGKKHVQAIRTLKPDAEIYALRSSMNAATYSGVHNLYSGEAIHFHPDFAIISNPTANHYQSIVELLPLGIPLFIEKPALMSPNGSDELLESIESANILTYVACNLRFLDSLRFLKSKLESANPVINEVNAYCGSYLPDWRPGIAYKESYSAIPELGGGVHLDLIHEPDYIYWLFGKPISSQSLLRSSSSIQVRAIDYANYQWMYEYFVAQITLNYYRKDARRKVEVITDQGTWEVDLLVNTVSLDGKMEFTSSQRIADTYPAQMEYFLNCISKNQKTFNTLENGIEVLKLCAQEKIYDSSKK